MSFKKVVGYVLAPAVAALMGFSFGRDTERIENAQNLGRISDMHYRDSYSSRIFDDPCQRESIVSIINDKIVERTMRASSDTVYFGVKNRNFKERDKKLQDEFFNDLGLEIYYLYYEHFRNCS
ncbi:MAG: hypothetical protein AABX28_03325 [Nanoarchaeota archaeon]